MKKIEQKCLTFAELVAEVAALYPDGKVEDLTIQSCFVTDVPSEDGFLWKSWIEREMLYMFRLFFWEIDIRRRINRQRFLMEFDDPRNVNVSFNTFQTRRNIV